jgi:hypothetical protein
MFRAKAAGRPLAGRTGAALGVKLVYLTENNIVIIILGRWFIGLRLTVEAAGTAKRGKCFHTENMGFPLGMGTGRLESKVLFTLVCGMLWTASGLRAIRKLCIAGDFGDTQCSQSMNRGSASM